VSTIDRHAPAIHDRLRASETSATTATDGEHDCNRRLPGDRDVRRDAGRALIVAWFRPMGADEVAYHRDTVLGREDDHPGAALAYYGSRGETPLRWGGAGAVRLGLTGEVTPQAYEAAFGAGGFHHPATGDRLVATRRPGFELVVSAHKPVAVLGVIDRADEMHSILDVETAATMDWLDRWFQERGGRRGRAQTRTATGGLTYAITRHATSRAGDPSPHDHVLVANVVEMLDPAGGFKGLDSAALRDTVEAATMVGRLHSAARAVALGFDIEPDGGPSGHLRNWRITGVPADVCDLLSKRADEIAEHIAATGQHGYRARGIAARATRTVKRHTGADELLPTWRAELEAAGWPVERLAAHMAASQERTRSLPFPLTAGEIAALVDGVLDIDGRLLSRHKVFTRTHLTAEIAPRLYGRDPAELERVLDHITASRQVVPLIGVAGAWEQSYTAIEVLAAEATISDTIERLAERPGPALDRQRVAAAITAAERDRGHQFTGAQRRVVQRLCCSGRAVSVVVGVAGSGKTTALDSATTALQAAGYRVLGTSTSGRPPAPSQPRRTSRLARSPHCCGVSTAVRSPSTIAQWSWSTRRAWPTTPTWRGSRSRSSAQEPRWCWSVTTVSWPPSAPAAPSPRFSTVGPSWSSPSTPTSARGTPPSDGRSPSSATGLSAERSPGTRRADESAHSPLVSTRSWP
jgi:conjugative relaxase-like TrwC/TraI family protein